VVANETGLEIDDVIIVLRGAQENLIATKIKLLPD
jgi:hypothetical protein